MVLTHRVEQDRPLVWAFAGDDLHKPENLGSGFIMLKTSEVSAKTILSSVRQGSFYWGNASIIDDITLENGVIHLKLSKEALITIYINNGQKARQITGRTLDYQVRGDEGYVRMEVMSYEGEIAGTQPFRVIAEAEIINPYNVEGQFHKGNLHAHSFVSDGQLSPGELADLYQQHGYRFLAVTDHVEWKIPLAQAGSISGQLIYEGDQIRLGVCWVFARQPGEDAHAASTPVLIFGTGVFDYNIPYVPDGTYQIEAIITTTGYPVAVLPAEILAEGKSSSTVIITGKEFIGGIDILLEDSTSEVINLAAQALAQNRNSGID